MKKHIFFFTCLFFIQSISYSQTFEWAVRMGNIGFEKIGNIKVDKWGNLYTIGTFQSAADFDPGYDEKILTPKGAEDIFIQKLDLYGNLLWAKSLGGESHEPYISMELDDLGYVYVSGVFAGKADFGLNSNRSADLDVFLLKLTQDGDLLWAKSWGGSSETEGRDITIDKNSNIYLTGSYSGRINSNPGSGSDDFVASAGPNMFILKLDSDGNFIWAKDINASKTITGNSITTDESANVYLTGNYIGRVDFNPDSDLNNDILDTKSYNNAFILKLNSEGNFSWVSGVGGENGSERSYSIVVDEEGNSYTIGYFSDTLAFNSQSGQEPIIPVGSDDIFVQKLDPAGNLLWVKAMGGQMRDIGFDIAVDKQGYIYTTGIFYDTVDFDPNAGINEKNSVGAGDIFIQQLNPDGQLLFVESLGSENGDAGHAITVDNWGNIYTAGVFRREIDFNPDSSLTNILSAGTSDNIFILKLSQKSYNEESFPPVKLYPNPTNEKFYIELPEEIESANVKIMDVAGRVVYKTHIDNIINKILLSNFPKGMYYINLTANTGHKYYGRIILGE
ncbi:MAG: SBBP repeat-containing protein [Bacteroidetes bacterium]|nr:SBBP repeat-containing protein [Bacteroidota bacterium]